jgi:DNA modification methylase
MQDNNLTWHAERRLVSTLKPWTKNPRKISAQKFAQLIERIKSRGFHDVLKIDTDNTVLSGNQRKKALMRLGIKEVTVVVPNRKLTEDERNKIGLESNTNDGEWNFEGLKSFELGTLVDIGFDTNSLADIWSENLSVDGDGFNVEDEVEKITNPKTKLGDLIIMGTHKLICGDSTDPKVLKKLFGKDRASMVYSDPVFNINYSYSSGLGSKKNYGATVNDKRTDEEYSEFLRKSLRCALSVTKDDTHVFYWSDQSYIWLIQTLYRELGIQNKRVCLWIKNGQNPTPGVAFSKCFEPCTYGTLGSPYLNESIQNLNEVSNGDMTTGNDLLDQISDIWATKRLSAQEYTHATSKPPKLHEKAIRRCTHPGDIILDSFSGSASTMIAAEQLKRRVYAVELEPRFCDLAIRRYEKLTGKKARIIQNYHEEN